MLKKKDWWDQKTCNKTIKNDEADLTKYQMKSSEKKNEIVEKK